MIQFCLVLLSIKTAQNRRLDHLETWNKAMDVYITGTAKAELALAWGVFPSVIWNPIFRTVKCNEWAPYLGVFSGKDGCIWGSERISHFITPHPHRENITYCICPVLLTRDPRPSWVLKWCIQLCGCLYLCSSMTGRVVGERIAWRESVYHYICVCMGVLGACMRGLRKDTSWLSIKGVFQGNIFFFQILLPL